MTHGQTENGTNVSINRKCSFIFIIACSLLHVFSYSLIRKQKVNRKIISVIIMLFCQWSRDNEVVNPKLPIPVFILKAAIEKSSLGRLFIH